MHGKEAPLHHKASVYAIDCKHFLTILTILLKCKWRKVRL
ncbi:Hypothetical protein ABZS17G119_02296 [Kosakonia cowanii]